MIEQIPAGATITTHRPKCDLFGTGRQHDAYAPCNSRGATITGYTATTAHAAYGRWYVAFTKARAARAAYDARPPSVVPAIGESWDNVLSTEAAANAARDAANAAANVAARAARDAARPRA